jgi:hypothetical protein
VLISSAFGLEPRYGVERLASPTLFAPDLELATVAPGMLGFTRFGRIDNDQLFAPGAGPGGSLRLVSFKSTLYDLPILEYRPYRAFDTKQSSAVLIQLFAGADVPQSATVTWPPGAPGVKLDTVYSIGLRLIFDWRRYF